MSAFLINVLGLITFITPAIVYGQITPHNVDLGALFQEKNVAGCFALQDMETGQTYYYNEEECEKELSPGLTFSFFNALAALENGVLKNESGQLKWDGTQYANKEWNKDLTLEEALKTEAKWYQEQLATTVGKKNFKRTFKNASYGNGVIKGKPADFWQADNAKGKSLKISAKGQLAFLSKLIKNELNFDTKHQSRIKKLALKDEQSYYAYYASSARIRTKGTVKNAWHIGWVEQEGKTFCFALQLHLTNKTAIDLQGLTTLILEKHGLLKAAYKDKGYIVNDFLTLNPNLDAKVDAIVNKMTPEQLIGQMIVPSAGELGKPYRLIKKLTKEGKIGGVIFLKGKKGSHKKQITELQKIARENGHLPLIMSIDAEPTLINSRLKGSRKIKNTNKIVDEADSRQVAHQINEELIELGFHQNFAPVVDVAKNSKFITSRSYGDKKEKVVRLSKAFIEGTQEQNIVATAKHFPGHGYVKGDTHKESVYIDGELKEVDVYKPLIDAGVASIMVSHITVKNNDTWGTDGLPSTCSRKIVSDLLKKELGYEGLVITDALGMQAVAKIKGGALMAAKAGNDMLLMPENEEKLYNEVLNLYRENKMYEEELTLSVKKIVRLKVCLGLIP